VDDAELVGGVLADSPDPREAARQLAEIIVTGATRWSVGFDPDLVTVLRDRLGNDPERVRKACDLGTAWAMGRRSVAALEPWELVASLPRGTPLPRGLRRTTGETLVQLVVQATRSLRLAAPFIDQTADVVSRRCARRCHAQRCLARDPPADTIDARGFRT